MIGDAEYKFATDFQQQDAFGRKELVKAKPEQVYMYILTNNKHKVFWYTYIH